MMNHTAILMLLGSLCVLDSTILRRSELGHSRSDPSQNTQGCFWSPPAQEGVHSRRHRRTLHPGHGPHHPLLQPHRPTGHLVLPEARLLGR
ncbi:hypothetical protein J8273_6311 [Carpediemonas membranifera]|uniref:Secreted protein n=1 Tax=Carpediemonas membranifera TaxID=201153 RepID=A0A8J6B2F4_9EUKA|nr:hypothetical protein J8273_6311 [Carpediemonas membranifera]|eukprot:KAG9391547.1 hypothetical protein J8273_6311 [Carpediemonas membranifera]